jgi:hypothetical protein
MEDTLPLGMWMSEALLTCGPVTSENTRNAISSPASEDGASPCASPDGPMTDLFGQALAPASHSAQPAAARRPMTNVICGLRGHLSSASADLEQSLVSRLRRRLDGAGSTLFSLTWKRKATPAHRPYFQLAASARRTSDKDCGSWPTARSTDGDKNVRAAAGSLREIERKGDPQDLNQAAHLASWPTPMAGTPAQKGYNEAGNNDSSRRTVVLASWATPCVPNGGRKPKGGAMSNTGQTPDGKKRQVDNEWLALSVISGPTSNVSPAPMEKPGQLNPDFTRWLMGYSAEHLNCAPMAMPSSRKSRRSS